MPNGTLVWSGRAHSVDYAVGANSYSFARELPGNRQLMDIDGKPRGTLRDVSPRDYGQYASMAKPPSELGGGRLRFTGKASIRVITRIRRSTSYDAGAALAGRGFQSVHREPARRRVRRAVRSRHRRLDSEQLLLLTRSRFESEITSTQATPPAPSAACSRNGNCATAANPSCAPRWRANSAPRGASSSGSKVRSTRSMRRSRSRSTWVAAPFGSRCRTPTCASRSNAPTASSIMAGVSGSAWSLDSAACGRILAAGVQRATPTRWCEFAFLKPSLQLTRAFGSGQPVACAPGARRRPAGFQRLRVVGVAHRRARGRRQSRTCGRRPTGRWSWARICGPADDVGLTLSAFHRWVSDTADFTPVGPPDALVDAPGNIGDGRIYGAQVVARVPLQILRGATVNLDVTWQHSAVTDPLTGAAASHLGIPGPAAHRGLPPGPAAAQPGE